MRIFHTRLALGVLVAVTAVGMAACGSSNGSAGASGPTTTSTSTSTSAPGTGATQPGTATAPSTASLDLITPGILKVGTTSNSKPYEFTDSSGTLTGFDIDLVDAVAAKMGLKPEFVTQDFSALLASVNNRQFDMAAASIAVTTVREKLVDFSDGYLVGYLGVMTLPDSGITDVGSLNGKRIAVLQGSIEDTYASTYIPGAQIVRFPDSNSGFLALQNKSVAGYFNDYVVDQAYQEKYPNLHMEIPVKIPTLNLPAGWAVHKGNTGLIDALNSALKEVVADGTWTKLYKKWFPNVPLTPLPPYTSSVGGPSTPSSTGS